MFSKFPFYFYNATCQTEPENVQIKIVFVVQQQVVEIVQGALSGAKV